MQVVGGRPSVLVGNSMGAYASLLTSAQHPEVSRGLVLVNGAGKFEEVKAAVEGIAESGAVPEPAKSAVQEVRYSIQSIKTYKAISNAFPCTSMMRSALQLQLQGCKWHNPYLRLTRSYYSTEG